MDPERWLDAPAGRADTLRRVRIRGLFALALAGVVAGATFAASSGGPPRPHIVWKPIAFGAKRRAETAAYSKRHYGASAWRLVHPRVIVEHYTASTTFSSAYNTFASDVPDSELHELPGTCAHFIVDTDGTIYQLVNLGTRCRHTVGLNYTAIGIEHVGTSDSDILHNRRQLSASMRLTLWLSRKFGIKLRNVIGHNESLTSPYHKELYPAWRCQTHGDWIYADMTVYRNKLRKLARRYAINLGTLPRQGHTSC
jgi:beta-N-acetylhexosaminidase